MAQAVNLNTGVNDSRIPCNTFGLWRRAPGPVGVPVLSDQEMTAVPGAVRAICWHGFATGWACYGPTETVAGARQPIDVATLQSPARYKVVAGGKVFTHPATKPREPGASTPEVPLGPVPGGDSAAGGSMPKHKPSSKRKGEGEGKRQRRDSPGEDPVEDPESGVDEGLDWTDFVDQEALRLMRLWRTWDGTVVEDEPASGVPSTEAPAGPDL